MPNESKIHGDCFAKTDSVSLIAGDIVTEHDCTALECMDCENCGFYKPKYTQLRELMKYNGTPNIDEAVQKYAASRQARGLVG